MEWVIFALAAAVLMGLGLLLDKKLLAHSHSLDFALLLSLTSLVLIVPFSFFMNVSVTFPVVFFGALIGITHAVGIWFLFKTIHHTEISTASVFLAFAPLFVFFFSTLLLKESLNPLQILGLLLIIVGGYALKAQYHGKSLFSPFLSIFKGKSFPYVFFFLAFLAVSFVLSRFLILSFNVEPLSVVMVSQWFDAGCLFLFFIILHRERVSGLITTLRESWGIVLLVSVLGIGEILTGLYAMRSSGGLASLVISLKRLGLLIPVIAGGELLHETNTFKKAIAIIVMIGGSLLVVWSF